MAVDDWRSENILVVAKAYPTPSGKSIESSCTAGIASNGEFVRLFPVPFRFLDGPKQFRKYSVVKARIRKATSDARPESHKLDLDSLQVVAEPLTTARGWADRRAILEPLQARSMEDLSRRQAKEGTSLGFIKPKTIKRFYWKAATPSGWTEMELAKLQQLGLFQGSPIRLLEKIPKEFHYEFTCYDEACKGHDMQCFDWEVAQSFRSWKIKYPDPAVFEQKFMEKYRGEMIGTNDTHFFVGTVHNHPQNWTIIGLFYPPKKP